MSSSLSNDYRFVLFQVGSEGRSESGATKLLRLVGSPVRLARLIAKHRPAIVHINTAMNAKAYWRDMWYVVLSRLLGCKVVCQVHGGSLPREFFAGNTVLTALLRRIVRMTDAIVVISQVEETAYREFVSGTRIVLIPNAIKTDGLYAADARNYQHPRFLHLVYVGRLVRSKGIFEAVQAIEILRQRHVAVRLSIAGSGPGEATLRKMVTQAHLDEYVSFRGAVFGAEKAALWRDADIFVFPTYHKEGLPYSLLEAMAAGAVPVVSSIGGIPDVMQDGVHGCFVPAKDPEALADAISRLDADRGLTAQMANAARQRVQEFYTVDRLARDFSRLYRDVSQRGN